MCAEEYLKDIINSINYFCGLFSIVSKLQMFNTGKFKDVNALGDYREMTESEKSEK